MGIDCIISFIHHCTEMHLHHISCHSLLDKVTMSLQVIWDEFSAHFLLFGEIGEAEGKMNAW